MRRLAAVLLLLPRLTGSARAGMPGPQFIVNELVRLRRENISFFLAGFLRPALLIQLLRNCLRRAWTALSRPGYFKALGLVSRRGENVTRQK